MMVIKALTEKFDSLALTHSVLLKVNLLMPTGYGMHQEVEYFNNCTLCPHCIYVFCIYFRTNKALCHLHKEQIGVYNRDEKCLQRGTDWALNEAVCAPSFKG
jgi:hypothetical protein